VDPLCDELEDQRLGVGIQVVAPVNLKSGNKPKGEGSTLGFTNEDYSSSAPSVGSSAASTFERRLMLEAWISAMVCLNGLPSTSSSTVRYLIFPSRLTNCPFWSVLAKLERLPQA
jgi:hypothetical protein